MDAYIIRAWQGLVAFLVFELGLVAWACGDNQLPIQRDLIKPNARISGMLVTTDGSGAVPVWTFCSPDFFSGADAAGTTECNVPPVPKVSKLAVGPGWLAADGALLESNWSVLRWDLYIDGSPVDLDAFGTFDADILVNNVTAKLRSWNVVLKDPRAGAHILRSVTRISHPVANGFHTVPAGRYEVVATFHIPAGATTLMSMKPINGRKNLAQASTAAR